MSASRRIAPAVGGFAAFYGVLAAPVFWADRPPTGYVLASLVLMSVLVVLSAIDLFDQRLPDFLTLPLVVAGIALSVVFRNDDLLERIVSAAVGYGLMFAIAFGYERLRGRSGLGLGDAKLFAAAGAWVGLTGLPAVMLLASGAALTGVVLAALLGKKVTLTTRMPFGPFLAFGVWIVWLYGPME